VRRFRGKFPDLRAKFENLIRKWIALNCFRPQRDFFCLSDSQKEKGMLLLLNAGIFYEFVKSDEFYSDKPRRYTVGEVELGINYLIISTNAGLWGYNIEIRCSLLH
jgi:hypothetical protein